MNNQQDKSVQNSPTIAISNGKATTTSINVAEVFGKRHERVLNSIRSMEVPETFTQHNFVSSEYTDSTGRKLPMFTLTRDGFTLLAMGFTGKRAMEFKIAYIEAFNRMEAELQNTVPVKAYRRAKPQKRIPQATSHTSEYLKNHGKLNLPEKISFKTIPRGSNEPLLGLLEAMQADGYGVEDLIRFCESRNRLLVHFWTALTEIHWRLPTHFNYKV